MDGKIKFHFQLLTFWNNENEKAPILLSISSPLGLSITLFATMKNRIKDLKRQISYLQESKAEFQEMGIKTRRINALLSSHKKELAQLEK